MRSFLVLCLGVSLLAMTACSSRPAEPFAEEMSSEVRGADVFNPWRNATLPTSRALSRDGDTILKSIGGQAQSIQGEARHRPHWREEIYPVVFGNVGAPHEILVLLDFAAPRSEQVWQEVLAACRSLNPKEVKVVVFGKSSELWSEICAR